MITVAMLKRNLIKNHWLQWTLITLHWTFLITSIHCCHWFINYSHWLMTDLTDYSCKVTIGYTSRGYFFISLYLCIRHFAFCAKLEMIISRSGRKPWKSLMWSQAFSTFHWVAVLLFLSKLYDTLYIITFRFFHIFSSLFVMNSMINYGFLRTSALTDIFS